MMRRIARAPTDGGFTLLELLVSLSLLIIMLALINGALRFGRQAWAVSDEVERAQNIDALRNLLDQRLAEALPLASWDERGVARSSLQGTSDQLSFVTAMPSRNGMPAGLFALTLRLISAAGLVGQPLALEFRPLTSIATAPAAPGHQPVLIEKVAQLSIRYYGLPERGGDVQWLDGWQGRTGFPRLIAIGVRFPAGDPRTWPTLTTELKLASNVQGGH
jgi:general secretion pathway protein J